MNDSTDALPLLLQLLSPGKTPQEQFRLLEGLDECAWAGMVREAERQNVAALLYLQISKLPGKLNIPTPLLDELRNAYLSNAGRNALTLHSAGELLQALKQAGMDVIGLKGVYLLENLYGDIGARAMNDIDVLVHKQDISKAIDTLERLGYQESNYFNLNDPNIDIKHLPPMANPSGSTVEVHWTLLEEDEPFSIDADALWERAIPARIAQLDVLALGYEDLIAHLSLHLTFQHYLKLGLRGLYDIALFTHKHQDSIDWSKLVDISRSWQAEKVLALTLAMVSDLLGVEIPEKVNQELVEEPIPPELLANARNQLLNRQRHAAYLTPDLVEMAAQRNFVSRIKLGLSRVFLPRLTLARLYGVSPDSPRILACYFRRIRYLLRQYGKTVRKIGIGDKTLAPALDDGKISEELHAWLTR